MPVISLLLLLGCGTQAHVLQTQPDTVAVAISGTFHGGQQPVSGSTIQMYAIGTNGIGSAAEPLLSQTVITNQNGEFKLPSTYTCPNAESIVYLTARGGNPGFVAATDNTAIGAMAVLGACGSIGASTFVDMNEVTTIGSIWPLAPFATSYTNIGYGSANATQFGIAINTIAELVNVASGSTPGAALPSGSQAPVLRINTLASALAACINSQGGTAGDGSSCGQLFQAATLGSSPPPANTLDAMLAIAANPTLNVASLFNISPSIAAFQPTLQTAPTDWTLPILSEPVISPAPGTYTSSVTTSLAVATPGAVIHYTTDGSTPSATSAIYTAPVTLDQSGTVNAVALIENMTSAVAAASYTVTAPISVAVTPSTVTLLPAQTQAFAATGSVSTNTAVTWTLSPALGTISSTGLYTAPATVATPATVTVTATSTADATKSASATLFLVAPVAVSLTPGTTSLAPVQTQAFTATVANTTNTAVTWTLNPAVGTISSAGLYTAPAAASSAPTVVVTATSTADATKSASATLSLTSSGATYYLSPTGSDANSGKTSSAPWLSPNHTLNCGDVILAAASNNYSYSNFGGSRWGNVNCPAGNNVAWLKCAVFDGCKISGLPSLTNGMTISVSNWGIQGWEVDGSAQSGPCFQAGSWTGSTIHHIVFANDIAVGCGLNGFAASPSSPTAGVDYIAVVGSIAYNTVGGSAYCGSGISVYEPVASDSLAGTHIYIGGNFSWSNIEGDPCNGGAPTDGEGIILDTFDGNQTGTPVYTQQAVVDNNIVLSNGGPGVEVFNNASGSGTFSNIFLRHNTAWGNNTDPNEVVPAYAVSEILVYSAQNVQVLDNLAVTAAPRAAASAPIYAYWVSQSNGNTQVYQNVGYSATGTNAGVYSSSAFSYPASNLLGANPSFVHAVTPAAPNCSGASNVPNCMATVIANFTPTNTATTGYGYQVPGLTEVYDSLFPQWLCNVNLPMGLVNMGCQTQP